jgi:hypothetical protein
VDEDLPLSALAAKALERRVRLGGQPVSALDAFAPEQPAEHLRFGLTGNRRHTNGVVHARERTGSAAQARPCLGAPRNHLLAGE